MIEEENLPVIYNPEKKSPKKKKSNIRLIAVVLISALIGGVISSYVVPVYVFGRILPYPNNYFSKDTKQIIKVNPEGEFLVSAVAKKAMPSVVGITTQVMEKNFFLGERKSNAVGTGVIVDSRGYILTNSHVVNNGSSEMVNVLLYDGTKKKAKILWNDPAIDLAVIKVDGVNVDAADLGDSDKIQVGEVAIAIGNPLGMQFERTVTSGIISGLKRSIEINSRETIEDLIQTDASINPGNSGGPLLNSKGEVIGINTAKIKSGEGLGFSIPINMAKPIVDQFIQKGEFKKAYIGIKGVDVKRFEQAMGMDLEVENGVYVVEVSKESPAFKGGLSTGDIIIGMDDKKIEDMSSLVRSLYKYRPNDAVNLKIIRGGKQQNIKVKLEKR